MGLNVLIENIEIIEEMAEPSLFNYYRGQHVIWTLFCNDSDTFMTHFILVLVQKDSGQKK